MQLPEMALAAVVVVALLFGLTARLLRSTRAAMTRAEAVEKRYRWWAGDRALFVKSRTQIADAATTTTDAVQLGSTITQTGHRAIAAIPFGIFGAIPATRQGSERVRDLHDGTADAVYDTIASLSDGIGEALRQRLVGEKERRERLAKKEAAESEE